MKAQPELSVIRQDGTEVLGQVLAPFLESILPAFLQTAEEIKMRVNLSGGGAQNPFLEYRKAGELFPLKAHEDLHPAIALSRIKIVSSMSILPGINQTGEMRVRFSDSHLIIDVSIIADNDQEMLVLQPRWPEK